MRKLPWGILAAVALASLIIGGIAGFLLGIASTKVGSDFLESIVSGEEHADLAQPNVITRERFRLEYPSNWSVDVNDDDYDPDQNFTIESPGSAMVMFIIGTIETDPEENIQAQIAAFRKAMGSPAITRFDQYGNYQGKGAILRGTIMGSRTTVKVFSFCADGLTAIIAEHTPDEDMKYVKSGLALIEKSFSLQATAEDATTDPSDTPPPQNAKAGR